MADEEKKYIMLISSLTRKHPSLKILNSNDQIIKHLYHINGHKMLCKFAWSILSLSSLRQIWLPYLSHGFICLKDCRLWSIPAKSQNLTMKSCPPVTSRAPEGSNANADTWNNKSTEICSFYQKKRGRRKWSLTSFNHYISSHLFHNTE